MITCWTRAGQRHTAAGGPSTPSRTLRSSTALRGGEWLPSGRTVRRLAVCAVVASETPRSSGARAAGSAGSGRGGLFGGGLLGKLLSSSRRGRPHRATVGLGPSDARFAARRACCCLCLLALLTASAFVAGRVVSDIAARGFGRSFLTRESSLKRGGGKPRIGAGWRGWRRASPCPSTSPSSVCEPGPIHHNPTYFFHHFKTLLYSKHYFTLNTTLP